MDCFFMPSQEAVKDFRKSIILSFLAEIQPLAVLIKLYGKDFSGK